MFHGFTKRRKRRIRQIVQAGRRWYANLFHPFGAEDLRRAIERLGISNGDVVLTHIAYNRFEGFSGGPGDVVRVLQQIVGETGTLLMPTIPFGGSALDYAARRCVTDLKRSPSAMGFVTEIFRRMPGVIRSVHPTHPVAIWGNNAAELADRHHLARTPCGENSPYLRLIEYDGKLLFLGADIRAMTFYHGVEEVIASHLPCSPFTDEEFELEVRDADGVMWTTRTKLFARTLSGQRDVRLLVPFLKKQGRWQESRAGRVRLIALSAGEVLETCRSLAEQGIHCYRNK